MAAARACPVSAITAAAIASSVVTPISGIRRPSRRPRLKAKPRAVQRPRPGEDGETIEREEYDVGRFHRRIDHWRQALGMATLHGLEDMRANLIALQQRHRTGAQSGVDSKKHQT